MQKLENRGDSLAFGVPFFAYFGTIEGFFSEQRKFG
tara:strand:- start:131 stop:238 length:108 start_codon:yes stop_codon:yes gene_type:complete